MTPRADGQGPYPRSLVEARVTQIKLGKFGRYPVCRFNRQRVTKNAKINARLGKITSAASSH